MPTIQEIAAILAARDFDQFIGLAEDQHFEVKSASYDLTQAPGRFELAKDVAAFATTEGGYLIVGLNTTRDAARDQDIVDQLTLIPAADFNPRQYSGIVGDNVFPRIEGLTADWVHMDGAATGLGVILVPPQDDDTKPFVISKVVNDGQALKQIVVGYVERVNGNNVPVNPAKLQEILRNGRNSTSQRLSRIESALDALRTAERAPVVPIAPIDAAAVPAAAAPPVDTATLWIRINVMSDGIDAQLPHYVIGSAVDRGNRIARFHRDGGADSIRNRLRNAGELGPFAYDIATDTPGEAGPGDSLETQTDRKHLRVFNDGTILFRCVADDTFLGATRNAAAFQQSPRINPVVVVEMHASYVTFVTEMLGRLASPPLHVVFAFGLRNPTNLAGRRVFLTDRVLPGGLEVDLNTYPLERNPPEAEVRVDAADVQAAPLRVAYRLVEEFYAMFDFDGAPIPFTHQVDGHTEIDLNALRNR